MGWKVEIVVSGTGEGNRRSKSSVWRPEAGDSSRRHP